MTRKESTNVRDLSFSKWIRDKLPDSRESFYVTDVDFFIYSHKTKKMIIVEVKTRNTEPRAWQRQFYRYIEEWINRGISDEWSFYGCHVVTFENTFFDDGKCYFDGKEVSEEQLKYYLSMEW